MHLFCDESGNTGAKLLDSEQPVFALASTCLDECSASALIARLLRDGQSEVKYRKLKGKKKGQRDLIEFFKAPELTADNSKFTLADKKFWLVSHLVDKLIEPTLHEAGIDLYERDGHVGLANVWYYAGDTILPGYWDKVLDAFSSAIRRRSNVAFGHFDAVLTRAFSSAPPHDRDFAVGLLMACGRLDEFIGVYEDLEVFDPGVDTFVSLMQKWMSVDAGLFEVTHDRSKPLRRSERFLRALMAPAATRIVGYPGRKIELPLRISTLDFGDSKDHPQLQVADLIAGAAADCLLAWSGRRECLPYHDALRDSLLPELFIGGVIPSPTIEQSQMPAPGEKNLVDGQTEFLRESGYFDRQKR
jgi:hypothetical protein